jgi:hypothetical protein
MQVAPVLPTRPAFGAPPVNPAQFQQMHQGQVSAAPGINGSPINATSIDDLIASAAKNASVAAVPVATEKKGKKDKSSNVKLVYADNDLSPEGKLAHSSRYSFTPNRATAAV